MVNKCSPIKLSMVLYCCGGLFDPGPALPGQNGDCSQLMDPATTPNYQQAAGTLQCGERDRNWWKCLFQLSIRTELSWWIHCLSVSGSASSISNIKFPLYSAVRVPSALMHDDDLININMHMHSALQLQLQCPPEMQFNPAEGKLRSAQTHSVEANVKCTRHHFCRDVSCHRWLAAASSNSIQNILVRWTLSSCSTLHPDFDREKLPASSRFGVCCLLPTIKSSSFLQREETNEGGQQQDR